MAGLLDFISNPTPRDVTLGTMLGLDPRALKQQALSNAALQAGIGMLNASGPSPYPVGWGKGLGMGLGGFAQGYRGTYSDALREGVTTTALGRAKRQGEREDELDRLRQAAILEAQTKGLPIPSREAGYAMDGRMVDPNDPKVPVRGMLDANPIDPRSYDPISASPLMRAIDSATGFGYPVPSHSVTMRSKVENTRGPGPGTPASNQRSGSLGPTGLPPAMAAYLLHSAPGTYAQIQQAQNRPHILSRGAKMVDARGRTIAEGGSPFPQVRNFTIGNQTVPHQYDEATGQWVAMEGMGGPRFSPRYRGELTPAQMRDNDMIDQARDDLIRLGLDSPEAIREAQQQFLPSGRTNPNFRRGIDSDVRRAMTRKIGDDPGYESFVSRLRGAGNAGGDQQPTGPERSAPSSRPAVSLPMTSGGKIDQMQLKHGETYELPDGRRAKWDSMRKGFEVIE